MHRLILSLTTLFAGLAPLAAHAAGNCATRDELVTQLAAKFGESFVGGGLQSETSIIEVWFSHDKGTWTILLTGANGTSCIMAAGTNWREAMPADYIPPGIPG